MLPPTTPERANILTLSKVLLAAFLIVGIALVFWGVIRSQELLARDDNPRLLAAEQRLLRGEIQDRQGQVLAFTSVGEQDNDLIRLYPFSPGGHAVGYYSLLHGTAGAEDGFDFELRGETGDFWSDWWRSTYHERQRGRNVRLTLDALIQATAVTQLGERRGAAVLLEIPRSGEQRAEILALASTPGYDPEKLDDSFEALAAADGAPLLNRVTQGQYQPGLLLQPLLIAAAVEDNLIRLTDTVSDPDRGVRINGAELHCSAPPPEPATWADILVYRCPAPMQELADRMGVGGLDTALSNFGLDRDPDLELDTETTPDQPTGDPLLAGIGQDTLSVTPLQVALAMGALAGDGRLSQAQLGAAVQDESGNWQQWQLESEPLRATSAAAARSVRQILPLSDDIREFIPVVLSGPDNRTNAWYVGMKAGEDSDYVAVVVLEQNAEAPAAREAGRALLNLAP